MTTKIAMITAAAILAAGLMVVACYTSSVWATSVSTGGGVSKGSTTTASGGDREIVGSSTTASKGNTGGAAGFVSICGNSGDNDIVSIIGACTGP